MTPIRPGRVATARGRGSREAAGTSRNRRRWRKQEEAIVEMPKPTPGHSKMKALAGNWEGEEKMHPSQWDPNGGTAVGRSRARLSLGDFALISDYEQERDGVITFTGHGVTTFDPKEDLYTYDVTDPEQMRTRMEMSEDGENWKTLFDGRYERR
jgi:hypothetical protein